MYKPVLEEPAIFGEPINMRSRCELHLVLEALGL